ncbi:unnamed protein product [Heterosigma akashiwo]
MERVHDDLDALNLITSSDIGKVYESQDTEDPLVLRQQAKNFRNAYKNWRMQKPKGATGEVTDLTDTKPTIVGGVVAGAIRQVFSSAASQITLTIKSSADFFAFILLPSLFTAVAGYIFRINLSLLSHHELLGDKEKQDWLKFMVNPYSSAAARHSANPIAMVSPNLNSIFAWGGMGMGCGHRYERKADHWICHLGVGGFHRSHQANYLHLLLQQQHKERIKQRLRASQNPDAPPPPPEPRWGFCGVGLMEWDKKMHDTLSRQDHLFTLVSRGHGGSRASVVGSIMDFVYAPADRAASVARLADPSTHLVSLTITEKGYCQNVQGELDQENSLIKHDLENPTLPCSAIGLITEALRVRRAAGRPPFTVLSCDNLPMNGSKTKRTILQYCELVYPDLVPFMQSEVCFPNTMVDRITPVTEPEHIEICKLDYGVEDGWPVFAEDFIQWVIEDSFNGPRPAWEALPGVLVVPDVHSYEWMKLRLLNGTHSALSYPSYLSGFRFVDDSLRDQLLGSFVKKYMDEVTPTVPPVPGVDLGAYKTALFDRFSNPYIKDKLLRLAEDGSQKLVTTMRDPMLELAAQGKPIKHLAAAIACFLKFTTGYDLQGEPIEGIKDPRLEELKGPCLEAVSSAGDPAPTAIVCGMVFGENVKHSETCISAISSALKLLVEEGIEALLKSLLEEEA